MKGGISGTSGKLFSSGIVITSSDHKRLAHPVGFGFRTPLYRRLNFFIFLSRNPSRNKN